MRAMGFLILSIGVVTMLSGCAVGPDYKAPRFDVPPKWSELPDSAVSAPVADLSHWWTLFDDPELTSLIERAVTANKDVKIAEARIRETRAQRRVASASFFPEVNASGSYQRERTSSSSAGGAGNPGFEPESELFQAGFDAGWEIDVFGGVRRSVEAADAQMAASEENRRDVLVILLSELARGYFEVRGNQARLAIARKNIITQKDTLDLTQARFNAGLTGELDVAQATAQHATTESQVPVFESSIRQGMQQLALLLGLEPEALVQELSTESDMPVGPKEIPAGLPSDLLRRRPDIRRAERDIAATTAQIGVATADLFPKLTITGGLGRQSLDLSDLALSGSRFWSIGPSVSFPVFNAGKIRANIRVQEARQEQALVQYEKTVLTSLKEVESALTAYSKEKTRQISLETSVNANRRAVQLANELYTKGLSDFLNVLESERAKYLAEDQLAQSRQIVSTNLVAVFKALGGGWEVSPEAEMRQVSSVKAPYSIKEE